MAEKLEKKENNICLLIGPEGGFSDQEVKLALQFGWQGFSFGETVLRAETAAIVFPALLMHEWRKTGC